MIGVDGAPYMAAYFAFTGVLRPVPIADSAFDGAVGASFVGAHHAL